VEIVVTKRSVFKPEFKERVAKEYLEARCSMRKLWAKRDVDLTSASRWVNIYRKNGKECFLKRGIKGSFVDPKAKKLIAKLHCIRKEQGWVRVYYLTKKDRRRSQACFITKANQMRQMDIRYYRAW